MINNATVHVGLDGHVYYGRFRVQFPKALRNLSQMFVCILEPVIVNGHLTHYRATKGTIRIEERVVRYEYRYVG